MDSTFFQVQIHDYVVVCQGSILENKEKRVTDLLSRKSEMPNSVPLLRQGHNQKNVERTIVLYHILERSSPLKYWCWEDVQDSLEKYKVWNPLSFWRERSLLLSSSLCFQEISENLSESDFFGNYRKEYGKWLQSLQPQLLSPKRAKRRQRHRGYRDKGNLPDSSSLIRREESKDYELLARELKIEELERQIGELLSSPQGLSLSEYHRRLDLVTSLLEKIKELTS